MLFRTEVQRRTSLNLFFMQQQTILGVELTLKSEEGIAPLINYAGIGRLMKNGCEFVFIETPHRKRVKNVRVAKTSEGNFIMYVRKTGRYKLQLDLDQNEMTQKGINLKVKALLQEAKEDGWI